MNGTYERPRLARAPTGNYGSGRSRSARSGLTGGGALKGALALLLAVLLLAACGKPAAPTPTLSLSGPTGDMNGVTTARLNVTSEVAWQATVASTRPGFAGRVTLSPSSGAGNGSVTLTVDPSGLAPSPDYPLTVTVSGSAGTATWDTVFSFPDVDVVVVRAGTASAATVDKAAQELTSVAGPSGLVTLLVGLDAEDPGLRAMGLAGVPMARAKATLSAAVLSEPGSEVSAYFDAAGLAYVRVPASEAVAVRERLLQLQGVRYVDLPIAIEPFATATPNDPYFGLQQNLTDTRVDEVWPLADGLGVTIAILDSGIYADHPDLTPRLVGQYDAGDERWLIDVPSVGCGQVVGAHGTHVAGVAAAATNNAKGVAGAAPRAGLYLVDLGVEDQDCQMTSPALVRGLQHVLNEGGVPRAQIVNMSLGTPGDLGQGTRDAIRALADAGVILIAAAGNDVDACLGGTRTNEPVSYPARYPEVWAIAAVGSGGSDACYSHVGDQLFLAAPGGADVYANGREASPSDPVRDAVLSTYYDADRGQATYSWMVGTSMAAPLVAAVTALLKQAVPDATPAEIKAALASSATDLGSPGKDRFTGYGLVDAAAAYELLTQDDTLPPPPPPPPPGQENDGPIQLLIPGYEPIDVPEGGRFTLENMPVGNISLTARSDENGNGVYGEAGEFEGVATVEVRFDAASRARVTVHMAPVD